MRGIRNTTTMRFAAGGVAVFAAAIVGSFSAGALHGQGGAPPPQTPVPAPGRGGAAGLGAGPIDLPLVDRAAADRGRSVYAAQCITCHGTQARGTESGANLVRSEVVLRDRYGNALGPFLKKGHPLQSGAPASSLTEAQVGDLMHFLRDRVNDGLRNSPLFQPGNVLTGDAKAGEAYFKGEGKCLQCHATNLAGIGTRLTPVNIQQRFLFPMAGGRGARGGGGGAQAANPTATTVTVTPVSGPALSGVLVHMDDFTVTLRDAAGIQRTVRRVPGVKVVKTNPFQFHIDLLDRITDKQMHDVVAYLETLK
jgi:cytochrome c oxidase cbb3-type subunit 3